MTFGASKDTLHNSHPNRIRTRGSVAYDIRNTDVPWLL